MVEKLHKSIREAVFKSNVNSDLEVSSDLDWIYVLGEGRFMHRNFFFFLTRPIDVTGGGAVAVVKIFFF